MAYARMAKGHGWMILMAGLAIGLPPVLWLKSEDQAEGAKTKAMNSELSVVDGRAQPRKASHSRSNWLQDTAAGADTGRHSTSINAEEADVLKHSERLLARSLDATEKLHNELVRQARDESWAPITEQSLNTASRNLSTMTNTPMDVRTYCASTICEVVAAPRGPPDLQQLNQMAEVLQSSGFDDEIQRLGLSVATSSIGGNFPSHTGIVLQLTK